MGFGGFFNSNSKSKNQTTTTSQNSGFSDIDGAAKNTSITTGSGSRAVVQESGALNLELGKKAAGNTIKVSVLDGGAIAEAFSFATDLSEKTNATLSSLTTQTGSTVSEAIKAVNESARTESENVLMQLTKIGFWAALLFGGLGVLAYWGNRKK